MVLYRVRAKQPCFWEGMRRENEVFTIVGPIDDKQWPAHLEKLKTLEDGEAQKMVEDAQAKAQAELAALWDEAKTLGIAQSLDPRLGAKKLKKAIEDYKAQNGLLAAAESGK